MAARRIRKSPPTTPIDIKDSGYMARQEQQINRARKQEHQPIPTDVNDAAIFNLSKEARKKLAAVQP